LWQVPRPAGGGPVRFAGGFRLATHLQQVGAHRVQPVIFSQLLVGCQRLKSLESTGWTIGHGDGDCMIERNDRVVGDLQQQLIKRLDLRPVGFLSARGLIVNRSDRGLELVWTGCPARLRFGDQGDAISDFVGVPERTVLIGQRHQLTVRRGPGVAAGVGEQHQRQQSGNLAIIG
jgi:hypothetical protein